MSLLLRRPTRVLCEGEAGRIRGGLLEGAAVYFGAPPCPYPTPALPPPHPELRPSSAVAQHGPCLWEAKGDCHRNFHNPAFGFCFLLSFLKPCPQTGI